jgi:hypothetical protein
MPGLHDRAMRLASISGGAGLVGGGVDIGQEPLWLPAMKLT